jgi:hypothetical protein
MHARNSDGRLRRAVGECTVEWNGTMTPRKTAGQKFGWGSKALNNRNDVFKTALSVIQRILLVRLRCVLLCTRL